MLVFEERGKPEFPEKNLSEQSREPTNSVHLFIFFLGEGIGSVFFSNIFIIETVTVTVRTDAFPGL